MAWLWDSWEEYKDHVQPLLVDRPGIFRRAQRDSLFDTERRLLQSVERLEAMSHRLYELGFTGRDHEVPPNNEEVIDDAHRLVEDAVRAGEELLLYHKRLAVSDQCDDFLHQKDLLEHWAPYEASGRIFGEVHEFVNSTRELLGGYHEFVESDERFLVSALDLPASLESDFRLARNLFSVGLDEVGVLIAGRGLEAVLREVAHLRKITVEIKGKSFPASELDVYDLIEAMFQVRWKATGDRLISPQNKMLLHYLRTVRNGGAHASRGAKRPAINPRANATLFSDTANRLWHDVAQTRARLEPTTVQKTW